MYKYTYLYLYLFTYCHRLEELELARHVCIRAIDSMALVCIVDGAALAEMQRNGGNSGVRRYQSINQEFLKWPK